MPFTWSSTNFTGNALVKNTGFVTIDPQSVASVRVVQVTGAGEDVSQWTTEVAGTETTLVAERQGEGTVKWKHVKPGVWKADLVIKTNGSETYREAAQRAFANKVEIECRPENGAIAYYVKGEAPGNRIRTPEINAHASQVATVKEVRV